MTLSDFQAHSPIGSHFKCNFLSPRKRGNVFADVGFCVCLSVTTITKKIVNGFVPNFIGRFIGGKGKTKFVFRYDR